MCKPLKYLAPVAEVAIAVFAPEIAAAVGLTGALGATAGAAAVDALAGGIGGYASTGTAEGALGGAALGGVGGELGGLVGGAAGSGLTGAALGAAGSGFTPAGALTGGAVGSIGSALNGAALTGATPTATTPIGGPTGGPAASAGSIAAPASVAPGGASTGDFVGAFDAATSPSAVQASGPFASLSEAPTASGIGSALTNSSIPSAASGASSSGAAGAGKATENSIVKAFDDPSGKNILSAVGNNIGPIISGVGLAANALSPTSSIPGLDQIKADAASLGAQSSTLRDYLATGTLPPGIQQGIGTAGNAAKASIKSMYATRGMSGSSAELQDLANVDTTMATQGANIAMNLLQQGISETQLSSQLYQTIMQQALNQDNSLSESIGNFAAAMAGSGTAGRGLTINLPQSA